MATQQEVTDRICEYDDWLVVRAQIFVARHPVLQKMFGDDVYLDLAQETRMRLLESAHLYDRERPFQPWAGRLMINLGKNMLRYCFKKGRDRVADTELYDVPISEQGIVRRVIEREIRTEVLGAIDRLPQAYRTVCIMWHFEDIEYEEMAKILEIPVGTVKSRLHRLKDKLAQDEKLRAFWFAMN